MYAGGVHKPVRGEKVTPSHLPRCDAFKSCDSGDDGSGAGCGGGGEDLDVGAQTRGREIEAVRHCLPEVRTGAKIDLEMELLCSKQDLLTLTCLITTTVLCLLSSME